MGQSTSHLTMLRFVSLLLALAGLSQALQMSFTGKTATVKVGQTSKKATCDITVSYSGNEVLANGNSVSCTIAWPKNKALNKAVTMFVVVGDVNGDLINVRVKFTLSKSKGQASSKTQTKSASFTATEYQTDDPASYPADLWCPAEDKIIFTDSGALDVVNETMEADWQGSAKACADNAACFSWTFNNAASQVLGLQPQDCRLIKYNSVKRMAATGVQSGYHKCWNAYSTSAQPC